MLWQLALKWTETHTLTQPLMKLSQLCTPLLPAVKGQYNVERRFTDGCFPLETGPEKQRTLAFHPELGWAGLSCTVYHLGASVHVIDECSYNHAIAFKNPHLSCWNSQHDAQKTSLWLYGQKPTIFKRKLKNRTIIFSLVHWVMIIVLHCLYKIIKFYSFILKCLQLFFF